MAWAPIKLRKGGDVTFVGEAEGGAPPPVVALYSGGNVTVTTGATGRLTYDTLTGGTELLDRTDPANPTFLTDGLYLVFVSTQSADALTTPSAVTLQSDVGGIGAFSEAGVFGGVTLFGASAFAPVPVPLVSNSAAASVVNNDGADHVFALVACIVKLS